MSAVVLTINPGDRDSLAATIERLVAILDEIDGDPDLEPTLGWTYRYDGVPAPIWRGSSFEGECEDGGDDEHDPAEAGIADSDALCSEELVGGWGGYIVHDGSGARIARGLLKRIRRKTARFGRAPMRR